VAEGWASRWRPLQAARSPTDIRGVKIEFQKYTNLPRRMARMERQETNVGACAFNPDGPSMRVIEKGRDQSLEKGSLASSAQLSVEAGC